MNIIKDDLTTIEIEGITAIYTVYYKDEMPEDINIAALQAELLMYISSNFNDKNDIKSIREGEIKYLYILLGDPMYIEVHKCKRNIKKNLNRII